MEDFNTVIPFPTAGTTENYPRVIFPIENQSFQNKDINKENNENSI